MMLEPIQLPQAGQRIALIADNMMYTGNIERRESFLDRSAIWLTNAEILPVRGSVLANDILRFDSICVLWDKVTAVSFCPQTAPKESR